MPRRGNRYFTLVKGAEPAMRAFKMEIAKELGYGDALQEDEDNAFRKFTTEMTGNIGGEMVRRIQAAGEKTIMEKYKNGAQSLMPDLPPVASVRNVTNTGNTPS